MMYGANREAIAYGGRLFVRREVIDILYHAALIVIE